MSIYSQEMMNDGPYIFQKDEKWVMYSIKAGELQSEDLPSERIITSFNVPTDQRDHEFNVMLKPGLSFELARYDMPNRLVAISDIEGNFASLRKLLQVTGVVDQDLNWTFGDGHLVLTGDFFDRGTMVTEVLWLIYKLEWEAYEVGGHVHFILGNHEIMNMRGDLRYVDDKYKQSAQLMNKRLEDLYSSGTELGQWLRTKNILEKIGDHLFVHGGISQNVNDLGLTLDEINAIARPYYDRDPLLAEEMSKILVSSKGPLWYRGYYEGNQSIGTVVNQSLKQFGASHIITGHTVVADTISIWHNQKVINIDTHHAKGYSEALLIENEDYYSIDIQGRRKLLFSKFLNSKVASGID